MASKAVLEEVTKIIIDTVYSENGVNGIAYYLQGSGGKCICCGQLPPHANDCLFVKYARAKLAEVESEVIVCE